MNAERGEAVSGSVPRSVPLRRWLAVLGVLLGWQLLFWPVVHVAEKAARPARMDAPAAVDYQLLSAEGAPIVLADSRDTAVASAWENQLQTVSVH